MKRVSLAFVYALIGMCCVSMSPAGAQAPAAQATASVAERSQALSKLLADIWEDRLKHSPEYASSLGDKRYNDQLTDYSVQEVNASLARGREFIQRLGGI